MYFNLFSNCIPVKGWKRCLIADLQNNLVQILPDNIFFEIITSKLSIEELKKKYHTDRGLDSFLNFLLKKELIFFTDNPTNFLNLNLTWKNPFPITNILILIDKFTLNNYNKIQLRINESKEILACCIRINFINTSDLLTLIKLFAKLNVRQVELDLLNNVDLSLETKQLINRSNNNIYRVNIYNSGKKYKEEKLHYFDSDFRLACTDVVKNLTINMGHFTESQCHNTCLNRKLSIDEDGNIKNCPYMLHDYGNIENTSLLDIIRMPEYRKWWYYRKDKIDVCQDCEFRHVCTDCRAFIKDSNNIFSQPKKCKYNPYIALWEGQEGWISAEKWRKENPKWQTQAFFNRKTYKVEDCNINLKEELEYFNQL